MVLQESKRRYSKNECGIYRPEPLNYHPIRKPLHFDPQPVAGNIPFYADIQRNPACENTQACIDFWEEQFDYCINGYTTAGIFIPGRYYFFLNFRIIRGTLGDQYPWFIDAQYEYMLLFEWVKQNKWLGIIAPKARRKGLSELGVNILEHGTRFINSYKGGICAGLATYVDIFKTKMDTASQEIRPELKMSTLTDNTKEIEYGYKVRNILGNIEDDGSRGKILMATMYDDPKKFEGEYFNDIICEESGEFPLLESTVESIKPALMMGSEVGGSFLIYGCVCAGTKVWNNKGDLINIEDLNPETGILGFDGEGVSKEEITYWQPPKKKNCYRITTYTGRILECSEDHPILWSRKDYMRGPHNKFEKHKAVKFVEAKDIKPFDQIATIEEVPIYGNKKMWEPRLVGWLIGDGSYGFDKTPVLSGCDNEINDYVLKTFDCTIEKSYLTKDLKFYQETRIRNICPNLRELGIYGQTKLKKRLPINIQSYSKEDICELLGGFFDTDGSVNAKKGGFRIVLTASSYDLLFETQLLLQKLGIHCLISRIKGTDFSRNRSKDKIWVGNDYYKLSILDSRSVIKFSENISFKIKYKQEKLLNIAWWHKNRNPVIRKGEEVIMRKGVAGLRFERVVSVEPIGKKPVYNLTAGTTNTYIANGIVTHNTGGNILSSSKGFKRIYDNSESLKFARFEVLGQRALYPNIGQSKGAQERYYKKYGKKLKQETPSFDGWKDYEKVGCEDIVTSEQWIIEQDERYQSLDDRKKLREHRQNFPRSVDDIFTSAGKNNFDSDILYYALNVTMQEVVLQQEGIFYEKMVLEFTKEKDQFGVFKIKFPLTVTCRPWTEKDPEWKIVYILNGQTPSPIRNLDAGGTDAYEADETQTSGSKMGICVLRDYKFAPGLCPFPKKNAILPVCLYYARPPRRDLAFEMSLKISVYWNLERNMMVSAEHESCMAFFKSNYGTKYLSLRPKTMDSASSQQIHKYGVKMTPYSKPRALALGQDYVSDWGEYFRSEFLIRDFLAYDEENIGTDWDLADACMNAIIRIHDRKAKVPDPTNEENEGIDGNTEISYYYDSKGELCFKQPTQSRRTRKMGPDPEPECDYMIG